MKKMVVVLTLALLAAGFAGAAGPSVVVQNQESRRFWYVIDPPGFAGEEPGSPWLAVKATGYFGNVEAGFPFTLLEPGASVSFDGLTAGTHYLLGFFEDDSLEEFPVRLITMQADSSLEVRHYDVYSLPELIVVDRGEGMLARFARAEEPAADVEAPPTETVEAAEELAAEEPAAEEAVAETVAEAAVEAPAAEAMAAEEPAAEAAVEVVVEEPAAEEPAAEAVAEAAVEAPLGPEVLATFAESYDPVYFTRESRDGFVVLPIASSRAWGKPGTRISTLSGTLTEGTFTLVLQSPDGFAKNASFFFYVFPERTVGGAGTYTFEARPEADGRAAVVLWQKGRKAPRLVGTARTEGGQFTWTASTDELPAELVQELGPAATLDLTTAWLDETSGTWEEFYFTTFAVADLTR